MLQPFIFSIQRRPYGKWREICSTSKRPPIWISVGNWQYPGILGTTTKKDHCVFSGLWPRVYQRGAGIPISFHSWEWKSLIPLPELWQFVFSFPSKSLILEIDFFHSLSVPDFWAWYDCTWVPPLCPRKSFPPIPDIWSRKRVSTVAGLEPAIPRSEVWCLIH